ncbi:MAG: GGDEF domain-containing protein [Gemmatimonadetes bacterium]|nr:GGDEF domain-containing protein [Gemmatimonadota bacterium]
MAFKERRSQPKAERLPKDYKGAAEPAAPPALVLDPKTGLYTMLALQEFILYEIDGGAQTEQHERFVTPLCVAAIAIDALPSLPDDRARGRMVDVVGEALRKVTRRADRLARSGNDFVALLRRTLAARAREYYAPHVRGVVTESCTKEKVSTTLSFGIASLTEHLVRDPGDMIKKAFTALEAAKKAGPGSLAVYDFRTMPY